MKLSTIISILFLLVGLACLTNTSASDFNFQQPEEGLSSTIAGCPILPVDNVWNTRIDNLPIDTRSEAYINSIGANTGLHPDFGAGEWNGEPIGIPYNLVDSDIPKVEVSFEYASESDPGPYPIPMNPKIEGGADSQGDRHVLIVDTSSCILYELYNAWPQEDGSWWAGSGAIFNMNSNDLRPAGWTSADAAGLPILPGLARYDEVSAGEITHALRFTAMSTRNEYIWPARHQASTNPNPNVPPMGQRFRLKASFDIQSFSPPVQVILMALKTYGMILADNGSNWYLSGVPDDNWDNDMLVSELGAIKGSDFEAVDESALMANPNSGQVTIRIPLLWIPMVKNR
jgi:hypothetical protein